MNESIVAILIYVLCTAWSAGIILVAVLVMRELFCDELWAGLGAALVGVPIALTVAAAPWYMVHDYQAEQETPDLVTLKKGEWACVSSHSVTTAIPVSTGKTTTFIPSTETVCDTYGRIAK